MTQTDDLLGADTSELRMLGQPVHRLEGERPQLECFTTKTNLTTETHRTREWVSLPPGPHQGPNVVPDVYEVAVVYAPRGGRIVEAKSLREYGLSFKTTAASPAALAEQVARDVLAATRPHWVQVSFLNIRSGEGACTTLRAGDEPAAAATKLDHAAGHGADGHPQLVCVTAEVPASGEQETHERRHETRSWVSQCPVEPYLTDIYHVTVAYAPRDGQVLDPQQLWEEYAASFSNTRAFAEALTGRVAHDVLAATGAWWVEVTFVQNIRGGWQIEAVQRLPGAAGPGREGGRG
jgi:NADPH-dependent 7-cyano-7-deazaguanine reductase QueF